VERGYLTESQRGGGGYIRVIRLNRDKFKKVLPALTKLDGGINQRQALDFIHWLHDQDMISTREAKIMSVVLDGSVLNFATRDDLRARMLIAMVEAIMGEG